MALFSSNHSKLDKPGPTHKLFTRDAHNFHSHRTPTIVVTSTDCGASNQIGNLNAIVSAASPAELFPTLTWYFDTSFDDNLDDDLAAEKEEKVKEYFLIVEDLDGATRPISSLPLLISSLPLPASRLPLLGTFYCIPAEARRIDAAGLVKLKKGRLERITTASRDLVGGFKCGEVDGKVWKVPKSLHRVHFQVVALTGTVDSGSLSEFPTTEGFQAAVEGLVLGWGEWVGIYEKQK